MSEIAHYIGNERVAGTSGRSQSVFDPATGESEQRVALASREEVGSAVAAAKAAWPAWAKTPTLRRARVLDRFKTILRERGDRLAEAISAEHGKTHDDALGEVTRGLEVVEFAVGAPHLLKGEITENVGTDVDSHSLRQPLGVVAGITPFNFPAMVPMWMFPRRSVAVPVTDRVADALIERLVPKIEALKVGPAADRASEMGPLVTAAHLDKVRGYVDAGEAEGARIVIDGRDFRIERQGYENGYYIGPSLIDGVTPEMRIWREEIFGPVLSIARRGSYRDAVDLVHAHEYANGVAIFTRDGDAARSVAHDIEVGMVGVNVPIPVPMAFHSFGGWKASLFGDHHMHGPEGVRFYTRLETITTRWPSGVRTDPEFVMPTMG